MAIGMVLFKCMLMMVLSVGFVRSDIDKDREECATQLVPLAPCLPYVGGTEKAPTPDCCTGIKQVVTASKKCICVLIRIRNDPSLGLKINTTLSLGLPSFCKIKAKLYECPALLNLPPNSADTKMFQDFDSKINGTTATAPAPAPTVSEAPKSRNNTAASTPQVNNNGGMRINSWSGLKMAVGFLLWCLTSHY